MKRGSPELLIPGTKEARLRKNNRGLGSESSLVQPMRQVGLRRFHEGSCIGYTHSGVPIIADPLHNSHEKENRGGLIGAFIITQSPPHHAECNE